MSKKQDTGKCNCGGCGLAFGSLSAFDAHRVGTYTDRRCLTAGQMAGRGFVQDPAGRWRSAAPKKRLGGWQTVAPGKRVWVVPGHIK